MPAVRNVSRRAGDDASPMSPIDVVEVRQPVFVRVGYALRPHQRVVRQPHHAAGHSGGTAEKLLLFDDQRFDPRVDGRQRGDHPSAAAARDEQVDGLVPIHEAGTVSVRPRSATGTSMVVLVFWIAGTRRSYGRPARKPSIDPLEVRDQPLDPVRQPHVLEALGVQAFLLLRQIGEVLRRDHRPARVVGCKWLRRRRPALRAVIRVASQRPDLEQRLLGTERPDPVRRRAAVLRKDEVVREAESDRVDDAAPLEVVQVGEVAVARPVPIGHGVIDRATPGRHRLGRIVRAATCAAALRRSECRSRESSRPCRIRASA